MCVCGHTPRPGAPPFGRHIRPGGMYIYIYIYKNNHVHVYDIRTCVCDIRKRSSACDWTWSLSASRVFPWNQDDENSPGLKHPETNLISIGNIEPSTYQPSKSRHVPSKTWNLGPSPSSQSSHVSFGGSSPSGGSTAKTAQPGKPGSRRKMPSAHSFDGCPAAHCSGAAAKNWFKNGKPVFPKRLENSTHS